jgi:glycosyltransferase involved in cell wall biosynthesis
MGASTGGRRILLDALAARFGGGAYAAIQIARHVAARDDIAEVVVLTREGSIVADGLARAEVVLLRLQPEAAFELLRRVAWESIRLPALVRSGRFDALISMSGMLPRAPGCHVVSLLLNPVMYERSDPGALARRWAVRRTSSRAAAQLVAPSHVMANFVAASVGRPCSVQPLGVDRDAFTPAASPGSEIVCVADFYAHKRHDLVLAAWVRLPEPRPRLRLIGNPAVDSRTHARVISLIAGLPERDRVVVEHGLSLSDLVASYRASRVFMMPSEHESFCMPLAESMACGVPAVARDISTLRETGGEGAVYVDRDDPEPWAAQLRRLVESDSEHARVRERALRAAERFSWSALAAHLVSPLPA